MADPPVNFREAALETLGDGLRPQIEKDLVAAMEEVWRQCMRYGGTTPTMAILPGRYFRRVRACRVGRWIVKGRWRVREDALHELRCMGFDGALRDVPFAEMYLLDPSSSTLPRR